MTTSSPSGSSRLGFEDLFVHVRLGTLTKLPFLALNRGESRHELARRLFFASRGVFRSGDYAEIMNKVSALSVLSNAVLVWNTVRIGAIVDELEAGGQPVSRDDLARVPPLLDAHVIATGS